MHNPTHAEIAEMIAAHFGRTAIGSDLNLASKILERVNGTPRASALETPSMTRLATPDLLRLDDVKLHARLVELRDGHARHAAWYGRWIAVVRQRVKARVGEEPAAAALGVSRATVRKSTAPKAAPEA